jgi:uncharacterized membrane protein YqgA involved in biofilm formation
MLGTLLNVGGILVGGITGLFWRKPLSPAIEGRLKIFLAAFTVFSGLRLTWISFGGSFWQIARQFLILLFALSLGKIVGHILGFQALSNSLGRRAREYISAAKPGKPDLAGEGFKTCAILFCASPLGILGSIQDGLSQYYYPLSVKAVVWMGLLSIGLAGAGLSRNAHPGLRSNARSVSRKSRPAQLREFRGWNAFVLSCAGNARA